MDVWRPEFAEAIPFRRAQIAQVIDVPVSRINNWIDRNTLWSQGEAAYRGYYILKNVFDLAGLAAMRIAHIPEKEAARYVRNYGFYRNFLGHDLAGDQTANFSHRNGTWDIGLYDPSAVVSVRINMRTIGEDIFRRLSEAISKNPDNWPSDSFESFKHYYSGLVERSRLSVGSAPLFEGKDK